MSCETEAGPLIKSTTSVPEDDPNTALQHGVDADLFDQHLTTGAVRAAGSTRRLPSSPGKASTENPAKDQGTSMRAGDLRVYVIGVQRLAVDDLEATPGYAGVAGWSPRSAKAQPSRRNVFDMSERAQDVSEDLDGVQCGCTSFPLLNQTSVPFPGG